MINFIPVFCPGCKQKLSITPNYNYLSDNFNKRKCFNKCNSNYSFEFKYKQIVIEFYYDRKFLIRSGFFITGAYVNDELVEKSEFRGSFFSFVTSKGKAFPNAINEKNINAILALD